MEKIDELLKRLNLVILFPGVLVVSELYILGIFNINVIINDFFYTVFLLVLCYSIGLICSIISRLIVDFLSENMTRCVFLQLFAHIGLKEAFCQARKIRDLGDLKNEIKRVRITNGIRIWNYSYRAFISAASNDVEVKSRREQGRYIRNLLFPLILGFIIVIRDCNLGLVWYIMGILFSLIIVLILYSYAELSNFQEAKDIVITKKML